MKTIAVTMHEAMIQRIDRLAKKAGVGCNRSSLMREAVGEYLSRIEQRAEEERETKIFRRHRSRLARQTAALVKVQAKPGFYVIVYLVNPG